MISSMFDWVLMFALYGQENIPEIEKETHRLAVVNMDWKYVKVRLLWFGTEFN